MRPPPRPQRVAQVRAARPAVSRAPAGAGPVAPAERPERNPATRESALVRTVGPVVVHRPTVVAGTVERFAERVEMRRRITRRRAIGGAIGVGVAGVLAWVLLWSPVLALDIAEVDLGGQGTVVDPATVMAVVQPQDGTPLPRLDTVELRRAILDVPGVRAAEVARVWPHGLRITVVSREPVAAVPDGADLGAGFVLLDVEGVQVGRATEAPVGLPVISVPVDDEDALAMTAVLTVLQGLPPELADQVAAASAETQDTVRLVLADGAEVEWGSADRSALKARVLLTLRSSPASAGAAVFDVSAPTLPITRA